MSDTKEKRGYSFGTFSGVFTPSILTILGVIMYLRFGWVLGSVGLPATLLIVTIATSITFLTGLSLSALATNMKVGGGGAYYIISRSLGLEAGAAIGLPLFFAQALGIAFYISGFSEAVIDTFHLTISPIILSAGTLTALTALAYFSASLAMKAQFFIFAIIIASLGSFFAGGPVVGEVGGTLIPKGVGFWSVFAVFFPAVTGIEAGISMSGDLREPSKSLPRGTLTAVLVGYVIYMALPVFLSFMVDDPQQLLSSNAMRGVARWGGLIVAGVFAASLSSALGALLGAPRTLQALAADRIIPSFIGRGYGKEKADPRVATAISYGVALLAVVLGDLNMIAPILSMFFLTSYGLLNLSAGLEGLIESPSWRPKFKVHYGISLAGAFACFLVMLMINVGATLGAIGVTSLVFYLVKRRQLNAHWTDMRYGILTLLVRFAVQRLSRLNPDERTWSPNILALSGTPSSRWHLIELASSLAPHSSALTVASVLPVEDWSAEKVKSTQETMRDYLRKREVDALVKIFPSPDMLIGARALVRAYGYGPLQPNTILLGDSENRSNYLGFSELIRLIYRTNRNLILFREADATEESTVPAAGGECIDVWWGGRETNIGLILTLAYQIQKSAVWGQSKLVIKTVVETEEEKEAVTRRLTTFIEEQRIPAEAEVILKQDEKIFDIMRKSSAAAGLVFMGIREPHDDESVEKYSHYYESLMKHTRGLPPVAMVLAAEAIEFRKVIGISRLD